MKAYVLNNTDHSPPQFTNTAFDVVAFAASAGGLGALSVVINGLKANFPAAIVIVQHLSPLYRSWMVEILSRKTELIVVKAQIAVKLQAGTVYLAPPNHHLLINADSSIALTQTEQVHFVRPSADVLFESVAASYKSRSIAVVLSGTGSDGANGVIAIKSMGGMVIVQDPHSAEFLGMPEAAIATGVVDFILPLDAIADTLQQLLQPDRYIGLRI